MATKNKQRQFSSYQTFWLCLRKEYIYTDARRGVRGLKLSKKVEKELQKRGFVEINKYYCKYYTDTFSVAADRLSLQAFVTSNEHIGRRQLVRLFYITDKQFGRCHNSDYYSATTKYQKEKAIII